MTKDAARFLQLLPFALLQLALAGLLAARCWAWFVVPLGARPVTWAQAAGFQCLLYMLRPGRSSGKTPAWGELFTTTGVLLFWFGIAWAFRLLMPGGPR